MSNALLNAVWPLQMPMARKFVLIALADYANDSGICFPSIAALAERCCSCVRTVQIHLQALAADGYVTRQFSAARVTTYRITDVESWPKTPHVVHPATDAPPQEMHPSGESDAPSTPQQMHPYPAADAPGTTIEPKQEQKTKAQQDDSRRGTRLPDGWRPSQDVIDWAKENYPGIGLRSIYDEFMDFWRGVPGAKGRKLDWDATFRNRVREKAQPPRGNVNGARNIGSAGRAERLAREGDERDARREREQFGLGFDPPGGFA